MKWTLRLYPQKNQLFNGSLTFGSIEDGGPLRGLHNLFQNPIASEKISTLE
jgi:hypothetical protein